VKCARCLWAYKKVQTGAQYASNAITVYHGDALCGMHLEFVKQLKREEGKDPWT